MFMGRAIFVSFAKSTPIYISGALNSIPQRPGHIIQDKQCETRTVVVASNLWSPAFSGGIITVFVVWKVKLGGQKTSGILLFVDLAGVGKRSVRK